MPFRKNDILIIVSPSKVRHPLTVGDIFIIFLSFLLSLSLPLSPSLSLPPSLSLSLSPSLSLPPSLSPFPYIKDPNWYKAKRADGQEGMIPYNYVKAVESSSSGPPPLPPTSLPPPPSEPKQQEAKEVKGAVKLHTMP